MALATVADLVPLRGENRALVRRGLAEARRAARPGLRALMASASVVCERLDEGDVAFRLAPRLNAAGRLYRADAGVELMLADDGQAAEIAAELEQANHPARAARRSSSRCSPAPNAHAELPEELADAPGLVLAGEDWHAGVVGIVASRLVERHFRPVVLIGLDGQGRGRGSARSVPGFDLLAALDDCAEHLLRHGGSPRRCRARDRRRQGRGLRRAFAARVAESLPGGPGADRARSMRSSEESLGHDVAAPVARLAPFGNGQQASGCWSAGRASATCARWGRAEATRDSAFEAAAGEPSGVAFGNERTPR